MSDYFERRGVSAIKTVANSIAHGWIGFIALAMAGCNLKPSDISAQTGAEVQFQLCSISIRTNCVVDGDTIEFEGRRIRVADIDAPEKSRPKCESEYKLAMKATYRLRDLLNKGAFDVTPIGNRDRDQYGRDLRVLARDGQSLGDILVREGLARTWTGKREPWC